MKLEINDRRKTGKCTNIWKLNDTFLHNQSQRRNHMETGKYFKIIGKKTNTQHTKSHEIQKGALRGKFISVNTYVEKEEKILGWMRRGRID